MANLQPIGIDDLKRMLGEQCILIEQLMQAVQKLEAGQEERKPESQEELAPPPAP